MRGARMRSARRLALPPVRGGSDIMPAHARARTECRLTSDLGATAIEYAIMLAGIALLVVAAAFAIGPILVDWFNDVIVGLAG